MKMMIYLYFQNGCHQGEDGLKAAGLAKAQANQPLHLGLLLPVAAVP